MGRTVARTVADLLARAGVERAYTVPGESFLGLLDELERSAATTLVSVRHEGGASFMAEADAKFNGVPAVVLASRGPGAANAAIGVHTSFQDQTPMLVILGQVDSTALGRESFQEVDLAAFFAPIAKWTAQATLAGEVPDLVAEALNRATTGRPGPAVLSVPSDFWAAGYDGSSPTLANASTAEACAADGAARIAELLDRAERPVAITGSGAARDALIAAAETLGLGVYTAFRRQDAFPEDHPHFLGHLGLGVPADQLYALETADLVLVLGTRLDEVSTQDYRYPLPSQQLVLVGPGLAPPPHPGGTLHVDAPARPVLAALRGRATARTRDWSTAHAAVEQARTPPATTGADRVHPADVVRTLRRLAPRDTVVTNDAGNFSGFLHRYWCYTEPRTQLAPANGAMGYAVPAAVAAKMSEPDRAVVAVVGDGGVLMTGQELETAVRHDAAIMVVVFQNGLYGTIAMHQAKAHGRLAGVTIGPLDLAGWARGLGAEGFTVDRAADLDATLSAALACGRPCLVDVRTDPDMITPSARLTDLLATGAARR
ncbi:MAG TPA: thiamine pyrophosphate-dependent enzyme [Mycobacteriales bacterium]|nr:thiamine pyrophosphate-dependent enzyme [Mycobacteriales bacterium]